MSETPMTPREAVKRLEQYGEEATFRVATYGSGNERVLREVGLTLAAEVERLRAELDARPSRAEIDAELGAMTTPDELRGTLELPWYAFAWKRCRRIVRGEETPDGKPIPAASDVAECAHEWTTALDGDDQPARDEHGRTWEHCGICGVPKDVAEGGKGTRAAGEFTRTPAAADRETDVEPPLGWVPTCDTGRRTGRLCDAHDGDLIRRNRGDRP